MKTKIFELTKENQDKYIDQVADLEIRVLDNMEKNGKIGQLFITGKDDILDYVNSKNNTVMCAKDAEDRVKSAAYITQGQIPFTYNDITKYFKCGENYQNHIKQLYREKYPLRMVEAYHKKIEAYKYARQKVLAEHPEYADINDFLIHELRSKNRFDEKSELRDKINKYMSEYILKEGCMKEYEHFYWITSKDILREVYKNKRLAKTQNSTMLEYDKFIKKEQLEIYSKNLIDEIKYYRANTSNTVEIDTYITDPNNRHAGLARILVYEGIKKHIIEHFKNDRNTRIYLCSTLHKDNLSSKYVSEFFGLTDNLFVKRRTSRNREVHICKIEREEYYKYLTDLEDKLIVLYNYNPNEKKLSSKRRLEILKQQLLYEKNQYTRLNKIRNENKDYKGKLTDIMPKLNRIGELRRKIKELEQMNKGDER